MPPEACESFNLELDMGKQGMENVIQQLTTIDVENAEASEPEDKRRVMQKIHELPNGATEVNRAVKNSMVEWFQEQFRSYMRDLESEVLHDNP